MSYAASGFCNVTFATRYKMYVTVEDCLASILATLDSYV